MGYSGKAQQQGMCISCPGQLVYLYCGEKCRGTLSQYLCVNDTHNAPALALSSSEPAEIHSVVRLGISPQWMNAAHSIVA